MPSAIPTIGVDDLKTLFPHIAREADGWDPSQVKAKSGKTQNWRCSRGHRYEARVANRSNGEGCPYCSGNKVLIGYNDLLTTHPEIAKQAINHDPSVVSAGSNQVKEWVCDRGHIYSAKVASRVRGSNCPYCSGQKALAGFNDLMSGFPEIGSEAYLWDPSCVTTKSGRKMDWKCREGHIYSARIADRTSGVGCPICSGKRVLPGFNDLQTTSPAIAQEAHKWDPKSVTNGSKLIKEWRCRKGHIFSSSVQHRTIMKSGCPFCSGHKVLKGFNDLATTDPSIADEAGDWDTRKYSRKSNAKQEWICPNGHRYKARIADRADGKGCPECAERGFNPGKEAFFYLMQRPGEQQIGITNNLEKRTTQHERNGWQLIDQAGPYSGHTTLRLETRIKQWLKREVGVIRGTTENWHTSSLEVQSLAELKSISGIRTEIF